VPRVIEPETKNWTWVLERECPECGFDASACDAREVAGLVRANAVEWRALFEVGAITAGRPNDTTWSTLEYACHVRDVYRRMDARIALMLAEDDAAFPNWDQDSSAVEERYEAQDPAVAIAELEAAAEQIAGRLDGITEDQWPRSGRRSDGSMFTVDTITRYMLHDTVHHIWDVGPRW
jgi:hypothetical protein